jgi:hypothetical protein
VSKSRSAAIINRQQTEGINYSSSSHLRADKLQTHFYLELGRNLIE